MSSSYRPTVAIAGLTGALGQATLDALLSPQFAGSFQLPIRVLMRDPGNFRGPVHSAAMAAYLGVDYDDPEVLDDALENVDVVINLLGMYPRSWISLGDAAYRCGAKLYIPSEFGPDHRFFTFQSPLARKQEQSQRSREDGIKTVQIFCGMLMEYVVPSGSWFGVDLPNRRIDAVVPAGLPEPKVSFTSIGDVAMAIASVARRRPNTLPDVIRISGDSCTLRQLGESWQNLTRSRVHIATTDLAAFKQSVIERNSSSVAHYYRLAAGEGLLDYSTTHANAWLSAGIQWQWKSIQQQIAANQPLRSATQQRSVAETRAARRRREAETALAGQSLSGIYGVGAGGVVLGRRRAPWRSCRNNQGSAGGRSTITKAVQGGRSTITNRVTGGSTDKSTGKSTAARRGGKKKKSNGRTTRRTTQHRHSTLELAT